MTHGSIFSGIGGFDLAAHWMKWTNVFHCEIDPFCQKIIKQHFPESILYEDIRTAKLIQHRRRINVLSAGFPCQPYSLAGKRQGTADDRNLWPETIGAVEQIQPDWFVGENVFGIVNWSKGLVFHQVQTDLEVAGYEVFPFLLPAASVGAPHRRDRIWFVAHRKSGGGGTNMCRSSGDCCQRQGHQNGRERDQSAASRTNTDWTDTIWTQPCKT